VVSLVRQGDVVSTMSLLVNAVAVVVWLAYLVIRDAFKRYP
jgi:hypothetical protein